MNDTTATDDRSAAAGDAVGCSAGLGVRSLRLSANERRLLRNAITSAIQNQTELIKANHDQFTEKPIEGMEDYIREWRAEIRAWKKLSAKFSSPNAAGEPRPAANP